MEFAIGVRGGAALALAALAAASTAAPAAAPAKPKAKAKPAAVRISVLPNRADLVPGGDALVAIRGPKPLRGSRVRLGSRDVTGAFTHTTQKGAREGLLSGLRRGRNSLTATVRGGRGARARHHQPSQRRSAVHRAAAPAVEIPAGAVDAQCNQPPSYKFLYRSTRPDRRPA